MASFHARIGGKRMRKRENKNYRFVPFKPNAQQKITKKNSNKIKKPHYGFFSSQNRLKEDKKERK